MRIASLIASATEMVCALGQEADLVGRSHECDFPASVRALPVLTEPKFVVEGSSAEIDARVKELLKDALSVYRVFPDELARVRPDVILTQTQCEVCAVSQKDVEEAVCTLFAAGDDFRPQIVSLEPNALVDIWTDLMKVADAIGAHDRGVSLIAELTASMAAIAHDASQVARPTVACIEWIEPLMAAGNWVPELVEMAGGVNLFGEAGKHSPWMTWAALREKDPDVIVVMPCGFDIARTSQEMPLFAANPGYAELTAVKSGRVFVTDGNQYFNRPGPRVKESLEILAELIHPEKFRFGHERSGWIRWP